MVFRVMSMFNELKESFRNGSMLTRLIYLNIGIFLLIQIVNLIFFLANASQSNYAHNTFTLLSYLSAPADFNQLLAKPWTLVTYMFLHLDFWHLLFNMLWFYWFGRVFLYYLDSYKMLAIYLLGGISGAGLYLLTFNIFPVFKPFIVQSLLLGASASIMAIAVAISFFVPNYEFYVPFIGQVKIKYIITIYIITDIISIAASNPGGHIAHLGGAIYGYVFSSRFKKGNDIASGFSHLLKKITSLFKSKPKLRVTHKRYSDDMEYNANKAQQQAEIDAILDKIAKSGYQGLTKEEKQKLFNFSKKQ